MRLLNLIGSLAPEHGGPVEGLRQYALALRRLGHHDETVVTLDAPADPWLQGFPAPVHALGPRRWRYGYSPALPGWLRAHVAEFDMVLVHGLWQYHGLVARHVLRRLGVPYAVFTHGMLDPWFRSEYPLKHLKKCLYWPWADYRVLRDAAAVLFTTREEAERAPRSMWPYRANPAVVGYGVARDARSDAATADEFLSAHPSLAGRRIVLFLGRIHPKKGCDLLIEAFERAGGPQAGLHLVIAGPDPHGLRWSLERRAEDLGLAPHLTWTGMLEGSMKWSAMRAAEVFILPSHQENFGVAVAEALSMGVPVLLSERVNIWREVTVARAGYAAPDTVEGTKELLRDWLELPALERAAMRLRARTCFDRCFAVDAAARALVDCLAGHLVPGRAAVAQRPPHALPG